MKKSNLNELASQCITHLKLESSVLERFVEICHRIRENLGSHDDEKIDGLKSEQEVIESDSVQVSSSRERLKQDIANTIGGSIETASVKSLESRLPESSAKQIAEIRGEIESHIQEIQKLSQSNTVLLKHNIDVFRRLLMAISGQDAGPPTYSAKGQLQNPKVNYSISKG